MSNPSLSGGGGITIDDVLLFMFGKTGTTTEAGSGLRYLDAVVSTEVV